MIKYTRASPYEPWYFSFFSCIPELPPYMALLIRIRAPCIALFFFFLFFLGIPELRPMRFLYLPCHSCRMPSLAAYANIRQHTSVYISIRQHTHTRDPCLSGDPPSYQQEAVCPAVLSRWREMWIWPQTAAVNNTRSICPNVMYTNILVY